MDFSRVALSEDDQDFLDDFRVFLRTHVTDDVISRDRTTGENFDADVHLALGARGYLAAQLQPESDGGFSPVRLRIVELETLRSRMPWFHGGVTLMIARTVAPFVSPMLKEEVFSGVMSGHVRLCLGFTEPEGGSDVATCKTRAVRDGDEWIINGSKMFTSNAHHSSYVLLLTNTDQDAPKHKNLTMFLVPLDSPGIEIQGMRTVDGDRTNIVYYSDVRVDDRYRVGEVNGGWSVMRAALDSEHGVTERDSLGLQKVAAMSEHGLRMAEVVDGIVAIAADEDSAGRRLLDDQSVTYRLGRSIARIEAALGTPDMFGRVAIAQTMRDVAGDLMDILGTASYLPNGTSGTGGTDGAVGDGGAEYLYRLAGPTGIYGGTLEVFRNMIAHQALGLPRPVPSA